MDTINEPGPMKRNGKAARPPLERHGNGRFGRKARTVTQDIHELGGMAQEMAHEKVEQLRENVSDYYEEGRNQVRQVERSFEQFIRQQPLKSILIAAGVGLVIGRFWMRR
jgi:ElaB/YqjD/DUF883 family membrane-anchored ribosome-binding protein